MAQLQDLFQTHAIVKILDFLTLYKDFEYTKTDIIDETGISRRTLYQVWPILQKFDLVEVTKSSGMIKFYKLNTQNPIAKKLVVLADEISFFEASKIIGKEWTPILKSDLPTLAESSQSIPTVEVSVSQIRLDIKGSTSQVKELVKEIQDKNGEIKIPVEDSTLDKAVKIRKREQRIIRSTSRSNGTQVAGD